MSLLMHNCVVQLNNALKRLGSLDYLSIGNIACLIVYQLFTDLQRFKQLKIVIKLLANTN